MTEAQEENGKYQRSSEDGVEKMSASGEGRRFSVGKGEGGR